MGEGGAPDWMIERGPDRSVRAGRRKHSKERESGVSEWKSARARAWAKQKGGEIAEERKRSFTHSGLHPQCPKHTAPVC